SQELNAIRSHLNRLQSEIDYSGCVIVSGDLGSGKTRLVSEAKAYWPGLQVTISCLDQPQHVSLACWRRLVKSLSPDYSPCFKERRRSTLEVVLQLEKNVMADQTGRRVSFLGGDALELESIPEGEEHQSNFVDDSKAEEEELIDELRAILASRRMPLLLVIE